MRFSVFLFVFFIFSCSTTKQLSSSQLVNANADKTLFVGRVDDSNPEFVQVYWPGTAMKFKFKGTNASIELKDEKGKNFFNVVVDNDAPFVIDLDTNRTWVSLVRNLPKGEHEISIYKRTEWSQGSTNIYNIKTDGVFLDPPPKAKRTIEFFGNSISAGYANEDFSGNDKPEGLNTNNYTAYTALTARALDADMYCTVKGGIGIMISWFPTIMPELYNRLNPYDKEDLWDFSKMTPDIVVINLFQNDSWLTNRPDFVEFKARFGTEKPTAKAIIDAYASFLSQIRSVYPNTPILCALGSMDATKVDSPWPGYVAQAIQQMNDEKIHSLFFPYKATPGHPNLKEHQQMKTLLVPKIKEIMGW